MAEFLTTHEIASSIEKIIVKWVYWYQKTMIQTYLIRLERKRYQLYINQPKFNVTKKYQVMTLSANLNGIPKPIMDFAFVVGDKLIITLISLTARDAMKYGLNMKTHFI